MFRKLKNKFIMLNMIMISVVMILAFLTIYIITYNNIQNQNTLKLSNIASATLRYNYSDNGDGVYVGSYVSSEYIQSFSISIDEDGNIIYDSSYGSISKDFLEKAVNTALNEGVDSSIIILDERQFQFSINPVLVQIALADVPNKNDTQEERIRQITFLDITDSQKTLSQLLITFILIGIVMLFVIFGISVYFAKRSVTPIEQTYIKQKQFIQDASHELKTPIASITANVDALWSNKQETVESQKKWIGYISSELERMGKLVSDLLYLARTDNSEVKIENNLFNISDTVYNSILTMEAVAYEKGLQLNYQIEPDIEISGDVDKVEQVIKILVDNAIKYVNDNGNIDVLLKQRKNQIILSISNTGEGISKEHLPRLFDRFYRIDSSRKHAGGYGLGLSIAKALVESMNGEISVTSIPNEKTTFTVFLNK